MKIVYVLESLELSGGVKDIVEQANGLARRGHDVSIVARWLPEKPWIDVQVPVRQVGMFDATTLPAADVHIATWFPTVVPTVRAGRAGRVFHFSQAYEALYPNTASRQKEIDEAYFQPIPKLLLSENIGRQLEGHAAGDLFVLGPAIAVHAYAPPDPARNRPRAPSWVGVVGPFEVPMKGIEVALLAVNRLRETGEDIRLFRASQLPLTEREETLYRPDHYAHLLGVDGMREWLHRLDLLIHGSFPEEGLGLPPFEAMASGVPVVMTAIPSLDVIPSGTVGRAAPGDAEGLFREAKAVLGSDALWSARRKAALEAVRAFDLERVLDKLERVLLGAEPPDVRDGPAEPLDRFSTRQGEQIVVGAPECKSR